MNQEKSFDLKDFLPYLLNQAAEQSSLEFETYYKGKYGMLRTEWRVLFHIGRYTKITAKDICSRARIHKTKVSRAVSALEQKRFIKRTQLDSDRRHEILSLTPGGERAYLDLYDEAQRFDAAAMNLFSQEDQKVLRRCLTQIAKL